ncbi:hypothetical protein I4U23_016668 [Adineta vaga]|nr:hypothetical protein I4U23_016668 [Adineta vaga]
MGVEASKTSERSALIVGAVGVDKLTSPFLPPLIAMLAEGTGSHFYSYDSARKELSFKLLEENPYKEKLQQVYPIMIDEGQLTDEMLSVIKQYTGNHYLKTNLNLLSNFDIDWDYTNKLRSIIRGLYQSDLRSVYYRGLNLSDIEVNYYKEKIGACYYTNSFSSFTTEKDKAFTGNALIILKTTKNNRLNIANVWKWSCFPNEMEAILSIASRLQILNIYAKDNLWIIEVQLIGNE